MFIAYIKVKNITGPGYAEIDQNTLSIVNLFNSLKGNIIFRLATLVNIVFFVLYSRLIYQTKQSGVNWTVAAMLPPSNYFYILISLIIIPQLIIYNKTGMNDHYYLPATIGGSLLTFYPISKIREQSSLFTSHIQKLTLKALIFVVVICIALQINNTKKHFQATAIYASSIQSMVTDISNCVGQNAPLIITANPYTNYEKLEAFKVITQEIIKNDLTYLATYGSQKSYLNIDVLKDDEKMWHYLNPKIIEEKYNNQTLDKLSYQERSKIQGIVLANAKLVENSLVELQLDWFNPSLMNKRYYPALDISVYCKK